MSEPTPEPSSPAQTPAASSYNVVARESSHVGAVGPDATVHMHNYPAAAREVVWPVVVGSAPPRASAYQVRQPVLNQLHPQVQPETGTRGEVLTGNGGVGKTQIAADLFHSSNADLRVWVQASSRDLIVTGYASAAVSLDLVELSTSMDRAAAAFLEFLASTKRTSLLVLDDVADPDDLRDLWPAGQGRVVVTTRRRDATLSGDGRTPINVGTYEAEEAVAYLTARLQPHVKSCSLPAHALSNADQLAFDLGNLPLALAQAAAVMVNDAISCSIYRHRFNGRQHKLTDLFPSNAPADSYPRTVATTWQLAVEAANRMSLVQPRSRRRWTGRVQVAEPRPLAQPLAEFIATFDPTGVPENVCMTDAVTRHLAYVTDAPVNQELTRQALRALWRLSLITHQPDDHAHAIRMHNLTGRAIIAPLDESRISGMVRLAADALLHIWPEVENAPTLSVALRTNVAHLVHTDPDALWDKRADTGSHLVLWRAGRSLSESGQVQQAVAYWMELAAQAEQRVGHNHRGTLTNRTDLARSLVQAGNPFEAVQQLERLLPELARVFGAQDPVTLIARSNLGDARGKTGNAKDALTDLQQLLSDQLVALGSEHPLTLVTRAHLAIHLGQTGQSAEAARQLKDLLHDRIRILGPDDPMTLITRSHLARFLGRAGQTQEAIRQLELLLTDRVRVLGSDHPDTLTTRGNLAHFFGQAGQYVAAYTQYQRLLSDQQRIIGQDHPDTLTTQHNLAHYFGEAGHPTEAVAQLGHVLRDRTQLLGPQHPDTLTTRHNIAYWLNRAGRSSEAARQYALVLEDRIRIIGPNHLDTLTTRQNLALCLVDIGQHAEAVRQLKDLYADELQILGKNHPSTKTTEQSLKRWTTQPASGPRRPQRPKSKKHRRGRQ